LEKRGGKVRLQIWDTAGQERYQNMTKSYFKKADGVMFVFDLGDKKSFKNI
jgi:small GTP-binding protein